jgi:hypothetical protein
MTVPAFCVRAVPDIVLPDGSVQPGRFILVDRLREQRDAVWTGLRVLLEDAEGQGRSLTRQEQFRWNGLYAELNSLDTRIARILEFW